MNNKIKTFTVVSFALIILLLSINFSRNEKYQTTNNEKLNAEESDIIDLSKDYEGELQTVVAESKKDTETNLIKPITFSWPCKGNILVKFSPNEMIYDEILEQHRTSNGVIMKTQSKEVVSMCDGKITSILTSDDYKKEITIKTTDNHTIVLKGSFDNLIQKEGNIILKGNKIGDIKLTSEFAYVEILTMKDNEYIDPISLVS